MLELQARILSFEGRYDEALAATRRWTDRLAISTGLSRGV
jgi:hypothetical protein